MCLTVFIMIGPVYTLFLIHMEKTRKKLAPCPRQRKDAADLVYPIHTCQAVTA